MIVFDNLYEDVVEWLTDYHQTDNPQYYKMDVISLFPFRKHFGSRWVLDSNYIPFPDIYMGRMVRL